MVYTDNASDSSQGIRDVLTMYVMYPHILTEINRHNQLSLIAFQFVQFKLLFLSI